MGSHHAGCPAIIVYVNMKIDPRAENSQEDFRQSNIITATREYPVAKSQYYIIFVEGR